MEKACPLNPYYILKRVVCVQISLGIPVIGEMSLSLMSVLVLFDGCSGKKVFASNNTNNNWKKALVAKKRCISGVE